MSRTGIYLCDWPTTYPYDSAPMATPEPWGGSLQGWFARMDYARTPGARALTLLVGPDLQRKWRIGPYNMLRKSARSGFDVEGWEHGPINTWITYRRGAERVHVCLLSWAIADAPEHPLFADLLDDIPLPDETLRRGLWAKRVMDRLADWQRRFGLPYYGKPGIAGTAYLRTLLEKPLPGKRVPLWHYVAPVTAQERELTWRAPEGALSRHRGKTGDDLDPVQVDARRAYLAAAVCAEVSRDRLVKTGPRPFDRALSGWWLIDADPWRFTHSLPDPLMRVSDLRKPVWVTTPTLSLWEELSRPRISEYGSGYVVRDSYTAPGARLFREWGTRINRGFEDAPSVLQDTLKATYRQTIGLLNREGGLIYRPDWHYTIIAQNRCTLWRKLWYAAMAEKPSRFPYRIDTDAATYYGPPPADLKLGDGLGQWQIKIPKVREA